MGGLALAAWNHVRATRDVDVLIAADQSAIDSVVAVLGSHGFRPKRSPPMIAVGQHTFIQFLYTPPDQFYDVQLDLLLAESELQRSAITRRVRCDIPQISQPIEVLRCDDLILFKLVAGRLIDRADAAMLIRENRDVIDFNYLASWLHRLDLMSDFSEIWREAFPDESPPA